MFWAEEVAEGKAEFHELYGIVSLVSTSRSLLTLLSLVLRRVSFTPGYAVYQWLIPPLPLYSLPRIQLCRRDDQRLFRSLQPDGHR